MNTGVDRYFPANNLVDKIIIDPRKCQRLTTKKKGEEIGAY